MSERAKTGRFWLHFKEAELVSSCVTRARHNQASGLAFEFVLLHDHHGLGLGDLCKSPFITSSSVLARLSRVEAVNVHHVGALSVLDPVGGRVCLEIT